MSDQQSKANFFRKLHIPGQPLVLFNIWDAGSAKAVAASGALAIATGSWSVADANGYADGEQVPFDLVIDNLSRIARAVDLPVTIDIESGYGKAPDAVAESIARTIKAGAIGCNLEDSFPENGTLRDTAEQVERIRSARETANRLHVPYFINARCDVFFQSSQVHDETVVASTLDRARAYADAGADCLFAPGLVDERLIANLAAASPLPLNIMFGDKSPSLDRLARAGVARVSHGPGPYIRAMKTLEEAARGAMTRTPPEVAQD
ncbi:MAG: isocitrate lyase/phosphoenolpyruvate mutase family protein [Betaproteobacteria bacterium]